MNVIGINYKYFLFALYCLFLLPLISCGTFTTKQLSHTPTMMTRINVETIPDGADVYSVGEDGNIGELLGQTPLTLPVGSTAGEHGTGACDGRYNVWSRAGYFIGGKWPDANYKIHLYFVKTGYRDAYATNVLNFICSRGIVETPGDRTITARLRPIQKPVIPSVQQQQQQQQTVIMPDMAGDKEEKRGAVMVSSNLEGSDVYVDGIFVGNTPANLKLKSGIHIIEVKHSGYKSFKRELRVYPESEVSLRAVLSN